MKLNTIVTLILSLFVGFGTMACGEDSDDAGTSETSTTTASSGAGNAGGAASADQTAGVEAMDAAGEEASAQPGSETTDAVEEAVAWGAVCRVNQDCAAPTNFCVIDPTSGSKEGYCSIQCPNAGADCTYDNWTCNVIGGCESPAATWCGPPEEVEQGGGVVTACE